MRDKLIERLNATFDEQYEKRRLITAQHTADYLIANGVTFADGNNVGDKAERLQKKIKVLEKSNRNWRRKCQRLRNPLETACEGCRWANRKRPQKCACCRRNRDMKDCYEVET